MKLRALERPLVFKRDVNNCTVLWVHGTYLSTRNKWSAGMISRVRLAYSTPVILSSVKSLNTETKLVRALEPKDALCRGKLAYLQLHKDHTPHVENDICRGPLMRHPARAHLRHRM